ncbi:hypothetical protein [Clostridium sp. KNHs214]|uniref:hypothetical protein n=1 Tax=Clostridium sp. KNHs214 TaxID=1540257 RepID=UPI000550F14D|nr:hypothetical protein [Clostridium sp. KNHs214]
MKEFIFNFFQIKKIIALMLTIVFCILALGKYISSTEFLTIFSMVIGTYFGQSSVRQATKEVHEQK